jgi:adenylate cyclase
MLRLTLNALRRLFWLIPIAIVWVLLVHFEQLSFFENRAMDWRFQMRWELDSPADIIYVNMDPEFIMNYGEKPWNRELFANTAQSIVELGGAKAIFFDFVLSPSTATLMVPDENIRASDTSMAQVIRSFSSQIILAASYSSLMLPHMDRPAIFPLKYKGRYDPKTNAFPETPTFPIWNFNWGTVATINTDLEMNAGAVERWVPVFAEVENEAYSKNFLAALKKWLKLPAGSVEVTDDHFVLRSEDGEIINEVPRVMPYTFYTTAIHLVCAYYGLIPTIAVNHFDDRLELRDFSENLIKTIPLTRGQMLEVNWFSGWFSPTNQHLSMARVLGKFDEWIDGDESVRRGVESWFGRFKDALVLVGPTDPFFQDDAPTPFDPVEAPRVAVHGNLAKTILADKFIQRLPKGANYLAILALTAVVSLMFTNTGAHGLTTKLGGVLILVGYTSVVFIFFSNYHLVIPLVAPVGSAFSASLVGVVVQLIIEERQKGRIKGMFGTYVSPELVDQMVDSGEDPQLGGEEVIISAYFSDIESFSAFSEILTPSQLVDVMNEYLTAMTEILQEEGGTLDKYIGDAIVAMFGAPLPMKDHALRGCVASQRMQKMQRELCKKWQSEGAKWPERVFRMRTRIGLNTGHATVGNMGSTTRFNYTMMGDTVNLAARSESGAKAYGVYTMVVEETMKEARKFGDDCVFRFLDKMIVKGRTQPVTMYEIMGLKEDLSEDDFSCAEEYTRGIQKYLSQDWDAAINLFEASAQYEVWQPGRNEGIATNPSLILIERSHQYKEDPPGDDWDGVYVMTSK